MLLSDISVYVLRAVVDQETSKILRNTEDRNLGSVTEREVLTSPGTMTVTRSSIPRELKRSSCSLVEGLANRE